MLITDEKFFCEVLDPSYPGLEGLESIYRNEGLEAAEKSFGEFVRANMPADDYFKTPYYERENAWHRGEDDYAVCERIMRGELISCGFEYHFPNADIDWEINPTDNGLKEWTWQLSRHHEWRCLAHCYKETGDEKYARAYVKFLMSWCDQAICPEKARGGDTKCWRTLEAGLRMIKIWHYCFFSFYKSENVSDHVITTYFKSIWEHAYRLRATTSVANWLTTELTGLAHIGMLYPFFKDSSEWKTYAFSRLDKEVEMQFYPDGFHYELTTGYHGVVSANYRYLLDTAGALGEKLPESLNKKLELMYEMFPKLCAPDGKTPALNDGGRAGVARECAYGAKYFPHRSDYKYFATNGREGELPDYTSVALPYSGMATMRTSWDKDAVWFFMESAPFGRGHQHEDKLNVLMFAYGKDVLADSGTYSYDTSEMRKFILDTRAHNCATVDDKGQRRRKTYDWKDDDIKKPSNLKWSFTSEVDSVEGFYDEGYGDELTDVLHKRKAIFFKKGVKGSHPFVAVIDRLISGDGADHEYQVSYQMNVQPYTVDKNVYEADFGDGVTMSVIGNVDIQAIVGQKEPIFMGWRPKHAAGGTNPEHYPAPCLRFNGKGKEVRIVTLLCPSNSGGTNISSVKAGNDIFDTKFTLIFKDGSEIVIDEKDYLCSENSSEKF